MNVPPGARVVVVGGALVAVVIADSGHETPVDAHGLQVAPVAIPLDPCADLKGTQRWAADGSSVTRGLWDDVMPLARSCSAATPSSCEPFLAALEGTCAAGRKAACELLAAELRRGCVVAADQDRADALYARALDLVERACADGDGAACSDLPPMYRLGIGTPPDPVAADRVVGCLCRDGETERCRNARGAMDVWEPWLLDQGSLLADKPWERRSDDIYNPLEDAFQAGSLSLLRAFLDEWHTDVGPVPDDHLRGAPQVVQETYALFPLIYGRLDLFNLPPGEWKGGAVRYALIQDAIVAQVGSEPPRVIERFRPRLPRGTRHLYPDERHAGWLKSFLDCDVHWPPPNEQRHDHFLSQALFLGEAFYDGTHGRVELIRFDPTFTSARFMFLRGDASSGGRAEKGRDGWRISFME